MTVGQMEAGLQALNSRGIRPHVLAGRGTLFIALLSLALIEVLMLS